MVINACPADRRIGGDDAVEPGLDNDVDSSLQLIRLQIRRQLDQHRDPTSKPLLEDLLARRSTPEKP